MKLCQLACALIILKIEGVTVYGGLIGGEIALAPSSGHYQNAMNCTLHFSPHCVFKLHTVISKLSVYHYLLKRLYSKMAYTSGWFSHLWTVISPRGNLIFWEIKCEISYQRRDDLILKNNYDYRGGKPQHDSNYTINIFTLQCIIVQNFLFLGSGWEKCTKQILNILIIPTCWGEKKKSLSIRSKLCYKHSKWASTGSSTQLQCMLAIPKHNTRVRPNTKSMSVGRTKKK